MKSSSSKCLLIEADSDDIKTMKMLKDGKKDTLVVSYEDKKVSFEIDTEIAKVVGHTPAMVSIGGKWYTNDVYALIRELKSGPSKDIVTLKLNKKQLRLMPSNDVQSHNKAYGMMAARVVGGENREDDKLFMPQAESGKAEDKIRKDTGSTHHAVEALQSLAEWLNKKHNTDIKMNNNDTIDLILSAIKDKITKLIEEKETVRQDDPSQEQAVVRHELDGDMKSAEMKVAKREAQEARRELEGLYENHKKLKEDYDDIVRQSEERRKQSDEERKLYEDELSRLADNVKRLENDCVRLEEAKKTLKEENAQIKSSSIDIKGDLLKMLEALKSDIERGGYLVAPDGSPSDDSFMAQQVDFLIEEVKKTNAANAKDLRNDIKGLLRKELNDSNGFLSKSARYMAYAKLPFMIEPIEGSSGLVPKRVSSLYAKVQSILTPFGFQQIIPTLFSETVEDGDYEDVSGQRVSPLSQLCPLLSQHKAKVDRDRREDVIADIAFVGFAEDGATVEKTKVLL